LTAGLVAYPQEAMLQPAAFQGVGEFTLDIRWQFPALHRQKGSERRVVCFDDLIEKGLLGTVVLVTTSIPVPGGRPGRRVGYDPRPCESVFL